MGSRRKGLQHNPSHEVAHDVEELQEDLAFEREVLDESIRHDYSTSDTGIVPLDRRRPLWHFAGLWTTFAAGFSFLFLGFELHDGQQPRPRSSPITVLGFGFYTAYAMFGAYLGSRTGPDPRPAHAVDLRRRRLVDRLRRSCSSRRSAGSASRPA